MAKESHEDEVVGSSMPHERSWLGQKFMDIKGMIGFVGYAIKAEIYHRKAKACGYDIPCPPLVRPFTLLQTGIVSDFKFKIFEKENYFIQGEFGVNDVDFEKHLELFRSNSIELSLKFSLYSEDGKLLKEFYGRNRFYKPELKGKALRLNLKTYSSEYGFSTKIPYGYRENPDQKKSDLPKFHVLDSYFDSVGDSELEPGIYRLKIENLRVIPELKGMPMRISVRKNHVK